MNDKKDMWNYFVVTLFIFNVFFIPAMFFARFRFLVLYVITFTAIAAYKFIIGDIKILNRLKSESDSLLINSQNNDNSKYLKSIRKSIRKTIIIFTLIECICVIQIYLFGKSVIRDLTNFLGNIYVLVIFLSILAILLLALLITRYIFAIFRNKDTDNEYLVSVNRNLLLIRKYKLYDGWFDCVNVHVAAAEASKEYYKIAFLKSKSPWGGYKYSVYVKDKRPEQKTVASSTS